MTSRPMNDPADPREAGPQSQNQREAGIQQHSVTELRMNNAVRVSGQNRALQRHFYDQQDLTAAPRFIKAEERRL